MSFFFFSFFLNVVEVIKVQKRSKKTNFVFDHFGPNITAEHNSLEKP